MKFLYMHSTADGVPFYIGVGRQDRAFNVTRKRMPAHFEIAQRAGRVDVQALGMSDDEALACEFMLISFCRLAGFQLANKNCGGAGARSQGT